MANVDKKPYKFFLFYLKNASQRFKNEWTIILCVGISLSLVSGLGYFFEAAQKETFNNSFWLFSDFDVVHNSLFMDNGFSIPEIYYDYYFRQSDNDTLPLLDSTNLELDSYAPYAIMGLDQAVITIDNYSSVFPLYMRDRFDYWNHLNASSVKFGIFDDKLYNNSRFSSFFHIMEGTYPQKEDEILVDYNVAKLYDYEINKTVNITIGLGKVFNSRPPITDYWFNKIENMTVVGTYLSTQPTFWIGSQIYTYSYTYDDYLENQTYIKPADFEDRMLFMFGDFSNLTHHPIQQYYQTIMQDQYYAGYLTDGIVDSGYLLFYDRAQIQYENLYYYRNSITQKSQNLSIFMPFEVSIINKLSYQLLETHKEIRNAFLVIQILNVPVIMFSLVLSRNINDSRGKKANEELILLKLRGATIKQIQSQLFIGWIANGVICTVFGAIFGLGTFYMYHRLLGELFFDSNAIFLTPLFTWNNLWYTLALGITINAFSIIPKMIQIKKMDFVDISSSLQQVEQLSPLYDEKVLFEGEERSKTEEEELIDQYIQDFKTMKDAELSEISTEDSKKSKISSKFQKLNFFKKGRRQNETNELKRNTIKIRLPKKNEINEFTYEDFFEVEKHNIKPITFVLIIIGLIPLFLYAYVFIAYRFEVPDAIIDNRDRLVVNLYYIHFFSLFFISFFITGIVRLMVTERPSRFARLSKKIAHVFIKKLDHIVSLELIRKKKWSRVIIYLSIFFSMVTLVNFAFNSQYRYEIFDEQLINGTDVRIQMDSSSFQNMNEIENFDLELRAYDSQDNRSIIEDSYSVLLQNISWAKYEYAENMLEEVQVQSYFIDPQKYLQMISKDDRPQIYPGFSSKIRKLEDSSDNQNTNPINVIVTSQFITFSELEIGDEFNYSVNIYNSNTMSYGNQTYLVKIVDVLDYVPGLYESESYGLLGIIIDVQSLQFSSHQIAATNLIQLIDIRNDISWTNSTFIEEFSGFLMNYSTMFDIGTIDPTWNDINAAKYSLEIGSSGFYGLINLDFVIIGFLLSIELSLTIIIMNKENAYFNELLLLRGIGRKGVTSINILETLIAFLISAIAGTIFGYIYSWFICLVNLQVLANFPPGSLPMQALFPIYGRWGSILLSYGIVFAIVMITIYVNHRVNAKVHEEYINKQAI